MDKTLPQRKSIRLCRSLYAQPGAYFITICTKNRKNLFWQTVGACIAGPQALCLTELGEIVKQTILNIPQKYPGVYIDCYTIMPNHIHLLLRIAGSENIPTVSIGRILQQTKGAVSKKAHFSVWQKSFYDHIVRNEHDYREICQYIESNPARWLADRFFESDSHTP